ncbi:DUF5990 family protein [Sporichthya sp.]|uniref:DUF5990 family protein n=1 Tax=Sporichthya sp. TaxID=65475 RepID=UPI00179C18FE|nr:DUF5990 family protein [Sporichthya sp.]MBA3743711.1 hypothetical protein [Sporichthya sp.]
MVEIRGHNFPGRAWGVYANVHCGIQLGREPVELVAGDVVSAVWTISIEVLPGPDFRGPAVQGKKGERFVYLTWGEVGADGTFTMFRRAKLMLADVAAAARSSADRVVATVDLSDSCGAPRCARLKPPVLSLIA